MKRLFTYSMLLFMLTMSAGAADKLDSARKLVRNRDYPTAMLVIDSVIKKDDTNAEAFYLKGYVYEKQNKTSTAISHYAEARDLAEGAKPTNVKVAKAAKQAIARLDKARAFILAAADSLERKAASLKSRDRFAYERLMKVVWQLREQENSGKRVVDRNAEEQIRGRYMDLFVALEKKDLDKALEYIDPQTRQQASDGVVKGFLGIMSGGIKMAQLTAKGVSFKTVQLGKNGNDAKVIPVFSVHGTKEDQKPCYFIKRDGKWYLGDEKKLKTFK